MLKEYAVFLADLKGWLENPLLVRMLADWVTQKPFVLSAIPLGNTSELKPYVDIARSELGYLLDTQPGAAAVLEELSKWSVRREAVGKDCLCGSKSPDSVTNPENFRSRVEHWSSYHGLAIEIADNPRFPLSLNTSKGDEKLRVLSSILRFSKGWCYLIDPYLGVDNDWAPHCERLAKFIFFGLARSVRSTGVVDLGVWSKQAPDANGLGDVMAQVQQLVANESRNVKRSGKRLSLSTLTLRLQWREDRGGHNRYVLGDIGGIQAGNSLNRDADTCTWIDRETSESLAADMLKLRQQPKVEIEVKLDLPRWSC